MTNLDEISERLAKATPGPWFVTHDPLGCHVENGDGRGRVAYKVGADRVGPGAYLVTDAEFIAHAPADMEYLLAEVETYRAIVTEAALETYKPEGAEIVAQKLHEYKARAEAAEGCLAERRQRHPEADRLADLLMVDDIWHDGAHSAADAILSSDWLAQRDRHVATEALREVRDALYRGDGPDLIADSDIAYGEWINDRADRIEGRP